MIYVTGTYDDRRCNACGGTDTGEFEHNVVKEIHISLDGHHSLTVALCSKCRQELVNRITLADGYGKVLEVK